LVKIRYNFAGVPLPIRNQAFRSFTGIAGVSALAASYAAALSAFQLEDLLAMT
jgi:hypothetical protein